MRVLVQNVSNRRDGFTGKRLPWESVNSGFQKDFPFPSWEPKGTPNATPPRNSRPYTGRMKVMLVEHRKM